MSAGQSPKNRKTALVTGGSSGIGEAIARALADDGVEVLINFSRSKAMADKVCSRIAEKGGHATAIKADVSDETQVKAMFQTILKNAGRLDYLVNNAGIDVDFDLEHYPIEAWKRVFDVNLNGKFLCIKHAIPLLRRSDDPRIVNIASRLGEKPIGRAAGYSCAEAGIIMLTKVAALELAPDKIKVNTVSPGLTRTPLTEKICSEDDFKSYATRNPSGRVGTAQDVAATVLFLLSKEAAFINGENINVSGGIMLA